MYENSDHYLETLSASSSVSSNPWFSSGYLAHYSWDNLGSQRGRRYVGSSQESWACKELLPTAVQALIIVLVALPFGYHVTVSGFILGVILLAIFGVGLGALSYALALASKNHDWLFWGVQQTLIFPLLILSGLLIPLDYGPQWMRTAATVNPANWLVQALRILLDQGLTSDQAILYGVLSAVTLAGVGIAVGIAAINRE